MEKKDISREQIIDTALELLRDKRELKDLNLRQIARTLGCAHTNLYNYFSSYTDLLWAAHAALLDLAMAELRESLARQGSPAVRLEEFFRTVARFYLDNTGWFRLAWLEYIGEDRPRGNEIAVQAAREQMDRAVGELWREWTGDGADRTKVHETVHIVHCYILGEVSNYIAGRGLIEDAEALGDHVAQQAARLTLLCMGQEDRSGL